MRKDVFYRVDGSTGVHVAKQLKKGEKIRICRNGAVVSADTNSSTTGLASDSLAAKYAVVFIYITEFTEMLDMVYQVTEVNHY